jgi:ferredoxin
MQIDTLKLIFFSPTGTTQRVLDGITQGTQIKNCKTINLTQPSAARGDIQELKDELVIIGTPVYAGRIPPDAIERIKRFKAHRTPVVLIVVYGNRAYEDALIELRDLAIEIGAIPIAAGAFIGEHSFSTYETPIAKARPDKEDIEKATEFGAEIMQKIEEIQDFNGFPPLDVPGHSPYKEVTIPNLPSPVTDETLCTLCGYCSSLCPTAAIIVIDRVMTDSKECISCCACVKYCPSEARYMEKEIMGKRIERLSELCSERKEPELFI